MKMLKLVAAAFLLIAVTALAETPSEAASDFNNMDRASLRDMVRNLVNSGCAVPKDGQLVPGPQLVPAPRAAALTCMLPDGTSVQVLLPDLNKRIAALSK